MTQSGPSDIGDRTAGREPPRTGRGAGFAATIVLLAVAAGLVVWQLGQLVRARALAEIESAGYQRLALYAGTMSNALEKYSYLPSLLTRDRTVRALLAAPGDPKLVDRVNHELELTNADAASAFLYVLDGGGLALAASNWADPTSFVGHDYAFRPYFVQARDTGSGRYYGVGVTTQLPGYFIARAAKEGARVLGVVVVKVDLEPLQREWASGGELVLVTDANQVAILSSRADWQYGTLAEPSPQVAAEIASTQQYANATLHPLQFRAVETLSPDAAIVRSARRNYLMLSRFLPEQGWTIRYLSDIRPVELRQRDATIIAAAASLAISLLVLYLRQRRLRLRAEMKTGAAVAAALRRARDELERKVEERTADLVKAQEELVHAGKMAALGQMSAAIAHELNQPLAAIQTFVASTRVFAERGDAATVAENLAMIDDLTRRMAQITSHLKTFARKTPGRRQPVSISRAFDRALMLVESSLRQEGIALSRDIPEDAWIMGDELRLEQVLVNLLRNAADAMKGAAVRQLSVTAGEGHLGDPGPENGGDSWVIRVADTGTGIAGADLDKLFDPFFSTKEVGQGLGLGLSLSYGIIRDFGGTLRAENNPGGGAAFVVQLPKASPPPADDALHA